MDKPAYSNEVIERPHNEIVTTGMLLGRDTITEWEEGGHKFRIDRIPDRRIGATIRRYELFIDDEPGYGGRYHVSVTHAFERAKFVAQGSMHSQIVYLWGLVDEYRKLLERLV